MGTTYAIDLIPVDAYGRSATRTWLSMLATEAPQAFIGFGAPVLAPVSGVVVITHDGEEDHPARRSQLSLLPYALSQGSRLRAGPAAIAGNHVVIAVADQGPYVLLAHLRSGSVLVQPGAYVDVGEVVPQCGNSGNSTQPHVHLQATDSTHWSSARGLPIAFDGPDGPTLPQESEVVRRTRTVRTAQVRDPGVATPSWRSLVGDRLLQLPGVGLAMSNALATTSVSVPGACAAVRVRSC